MEENNLQSDTHIKNRFVIFGDFAVGGYVPARIRVNSIDEYYIDSTGVLRIILKDGRKHSFKYSKVEATKKLLDKLDSLFNIRII